MEIKDECMLSTRRTSIRAHRTDETNQTDHILVDNKHIKNITDTGSYRGVDAESYTVCPFSI